MKKYLLTTLAITFSVSMNFAQTSKKDASASFGVRGNCGMCKTTIEKAATQVAGVSTANWDKEIKKIAITYNAKKTNAASVEKAIAAAGYATQTQAANDKAYKALPGCCQYDPVMKLASDDKKSCCTDSETACDKH